MSNSLQLYREKLKQWDADGVFPARGSIDELKYLLSQMTGQDLAEVLRKDESSLVFVREAEFREALARAISK